MARQINEAGLNLIRGFESFEPDWYADPVGVLTIGYGHTGKLPGDFLSRVPLSPSDGERLLQHDLRPREAAVSKAVKVPVTDNQFAALVSLVYNIGEGAFQRSTLLKRLNSGQYEDAADELLRWVYAGGNKLRGLVRRREAERTLFLTPDAKEKVPDSAKATEGQDLAAELDDIIARLTDLRGRL